MEFHENLSAFRKAKGLSQEEFAEKLGVSRQAISKWENGLTSPEMANIGKICEILEVTPNALLGYEEKPQQQEETKHGHEKKQRPWYKTLLIIVAGIVVANIVMVVISIALCGGVFCVYPDKFAETEQTTVAPQVDMPVVKSYDIEALETKDGCRTFRVSFVPTLINEDFEYSISVVTNGEKEKEYAAKVVGGVCSADIELELSLVNRTVIVALITVGDTTYANELTTITRVEADSITYE